MESMSFIIAGYFLCRLEDRKGQLVRMLHLPKAGFFSCIVLVFFLFTLTRK